MKEFFIASALVLLIGGGLYYASKKGKKTTLDVSSIDEETLDGELKLSDVVDFFKNKGLNKEVDIPCLIHPQILQGVKTSYYTRLQTSEGWIFNNHCSCI